MTDFEKLLLLQQATGQRIKDGGYEWEFIDPATGEAYFDPTTKKNFVKFYGPSTGSTGLKFTQGNQSYEASLAKLATDKDKEIQTVISSTQPMALQSIAPTQPMALQSIAPTQPITPEVDLTEAGKEASKKINIDRQRMNKIVGLGVPALIGLGQAAYQFSPLSETEQDVYAKEELARLRGTDPGMSAAEQSQYFQQIYAPQKAALAETERRREAGMATQGGVRSAASLMAERGATAQAMGRALEGAGVALNQAQMQEVEKDIAKKEALIAYQGQRRQARTDAGFEALTDLGALAGMAMGGRAVGGVNLASDIVGIATQQGVNLSASQISDLNKDLTKYPMMTENYLNKTLLSYGINPDSLTETQKQAFFRS